MQRTSQRLAGLARQGLQRGAAEGALGQALRALGAAAAAGTHRTLASSSQLASRYQVTSRTLGMSSEENRPLPSSGSTVVLVSGGIESAALLSYYAHWDHAQQLLPLFIDYGQRNARAEEAAQQAICRHLDLDFNAINASMVAHQLNMSADGKRYHDPLPHRNLLLASLAASFAADSQAANVAICLTKDDLGHYSSATMPFLHNVEALYQNLEPQLTLLMPLLGLRKAQVLKMGEQVKAPWQLTYSCAEGNKSPCGTCDPCLAREEAFAKAELKDPLLESPADK